MAHRLSRPSATIALLDDEPDVVQPATCPPAAPGGAFSADSIGMPLD